MTKNGLANFSMFWTLLLSFQLLTPVLTDDDDVNVVVQEVPMPVEEATKENFVDLVLAHPYALVLFYETGCEDCEQAKTTMANIMRPDMFPSGFKKIQISDEEQAAKFGVDVFPSFVLMRGGADNPVKYDGETVDTESLENWLDIAHEVATKTLTDESFEHLTQASTGSTTGDWLVAFYKTSCSSILSVMESFGVRVRRKMNVAKVDMEFSPKLTKRLNLEKCPTLIFFRQGKMYRYEVEKYDTKSLTSFVEGWYKNMKAEKVPGEPTGFDELTEDIAKALKGQLQGPNRSVFLAIVGGVVFLVLLVLVCSCVMSRKREAQRKKLY